MTITGDERTEDDAEAHPRARPRRALVAALTLALVLGAVAVAKPRFDGWAADQRRADAAAFLDRLEQMPPPDGTVEDPTWSACMGMGERCFRAAPTYDEVTLSTVCEAVEAIGTDMKDCARPAAGLPGLEQVVGTFGRARVLITAVGGEFATDLPPPTAWSVGLVRDLDDDWSLPDAGPADPLPSDLGDLHLLPDGWAMGVPCALPEPGGCGLFSFQRRVPDSPPVSARRLGAALEQAGLRVDVVRCPPQAGRCLVAASGYLGPRATRGISVVGFTKAAGARSGSTLRLSVSTLPGAGPGSGSDDLTTTLPPADGVYIG